MDWFGIRVVVLLDDCEQFNLVSELIGELDFVKGDFRNSFDVNRIHAEPVAVRERSGDGGLVGGIESVDVERRIGFGVTELLGIRENLFEVRLIAFHARENIVAGSVENAVNPVDAVANKTFTKALDDRNAAADTGFIEDVGSGFFRFGKQLFAVLGEQGFIGGDNRFSAFQSFENNRFRKCGSADEFNNDLAGFDRLHRICSQHFPRDFDAAVAHDVEIGDFPDDRFHTGAFRNDFTVFYKTVGNAGAHGSESNNSNSKLLHGELLLRLVLYDNRLI